MTEHTQKSFEIRPGGHTSNEGGREGGRGEAGRGGRKEGRREGRKEGAVGMRDKGCAPL